MRAISDFVLSPTTKYGIYNLVGPCEKLKFIDFIEPAKSIINPNIKLKFVNPKACQLPMYRADHFNRQLFNVDGSKAYSEGLKKYTAENAIRSVLEFLN